MKLLTAQAATAVSRHLGLSPAVSPRLVDSIIRGWPADELPPVEGGKRRWSREHVDRLRAAVAARMATAATAAPPAA